MNWDKIRQWCVYASIVIVTFVVARLWVSEKMFNWCYYYSGNASFCLDIKKHV